MPRNAASRTAASRRHRRGGIDGYRRPFSEVIEPDISDRFSLEPGEGVSAQRCGRLGDQALGSGLVGRLLRKLRQRLAAGESKRRDEHAASCRS
ncbi:MAG: hypothetical protein U1E38_06530 [Rhodospirillales bacterium]